MRDALSESLYTLLLDLNQQWTRPMNIHDVFKNDFLHNLGTDHIAVDHSGTPIARATDRTAVERAAPDAAAYFSGADFDAAEQPVEALEPVLAPEPPVVAPEADFVAPEAVKPNDEQSQTANQLPDGPEIEQPPQDNDHIAPGAEEFPEPVVPAEEDDDTAQN